MTEHKGFKHSKYNIPEGKYTADENGDVFVNGKICKYHKSKNGGYFIRVCGKGVDTSLTKAFIVLTAFQGEGEPGEKAHHINGDPLDDKPSNLKWATEKEISRFRMSKPENFKRVQAMGRSHKGKKLEIGRNQKLTKTQIKDIYYLLEDECTNDEIAKILDLPIKENSINNYRYKYYKEKKQKEAAAQSAEAESVESVE